MFLERKQHSRILCIGAAVYAILVSAVALLPGGELRFDFCGQVDVGGLMENGCTLGNATDVAFGFFLSTDPYSYLHMLDTFVLTVLFTMGAAYARMAVLRYKKWAWFREDAALIRSMRKSLQKAIWP